MSTLQKTRKYYKWSWDVSLGGDYDAWGCSTYFMEIDSNLYACRQIEIYENGNILFYDKSHVYDEYGMLCDKKIDDKNIEEFAISEAEFEQIWQTQTPINK